MVKITLAELISAGRAAARLTQEELAKKAGLHRVYIAQLETGAKSDPSYSLVKRLCKALGPHFTDAVKADLESDCVKVKKSRKKPVKAID